MIPKPIGQITETDLNALIEAAVLERKTLDYKQQLPDYNDAGKRELLADLSSFANSEGGDLVFGIAENAGAPTEILGVQVVDVDREILRIDGIIRDGLSPRIRHTTQAVPLANARYVVVIRSERSWYGPHRVVFKGDGRFYGRTSNGKYELDVTELRNAFLFSNTLRDKIAAFRAERVMAIENGRAMIPLTAGPKLIVHSLPLESFDNKVVPTSTSIREIPIIGGQRVQAFRHGINFEGQICLATGEPSKAYTQVYRNGVIEAVRCGLLNSVEDPRLIPSLLYEETLVRYLRESLRLMRTIGCHPPVLIGISLLGVKGLCLAVGGRNRYSASDGVPIDRDVLILPDIVFDDLSAPFGDLVKPTFDLVWNACGYPESPYFEPGGDWNGRV